MRSSYAGGDKLYVPVENIDVLSRYGSGEDAVALDRLGGEAWQRRKARLKERIREIADELLGTAALRALRQAPAYEPGQRRLSRLRRPLPLSRKPTTRTAPFDDVLDDLAAGKPMDRLVCGDVGFGKTEVALRAAFVAAMAGAQVALICADHPARAPAFPELRGALPRLPAQGRPPLPPRRRQRGQGRPRRASPTARSTSSSAPTRSSPRASSSSASASSSSTRSSASASSTRSASSSSRPTSMC